MHVLGAFTKESTMNTINIMDHPLQNVVGHEIEGLGRQHGVHKDESTSSRKKITLSSNKSLLNSINKRLPILPSE